MRPVRQRGILLLPVVLMLAIVGALAFAMTRDGSMSVSAVEREYEIARVRYLAEAGVTLAKWQNEQKGCGKTERHPGAISFPGGTVTINNVKKADYGVNVDVTATLTQDADPAIRPAALTITRDVRLHELGSKMEVTIGSQDGSDTHVQSGAGVLDTEKYLEMTDGKSHGLIRFSLGLIPAEVIVTKAELRLKQQSNLPSSQPTSSLSVHRVTTDWDVKAATWTAPWTADGGDYAAPPVATATIMDNVPGPYSWRIDALVESWVNGTLPSYGLLLKPDGLTQARFYSFDNGSDGPEVFVRYYPSCQK